jgi:hypothetical protein
VRFSTNSNVANATFELVDAMAGATIESNLSEPYASGESSVLNRCPPIWHPDAPMMGRAKRPGKSF